MKKTMKKMASITGVITALSLGNACAGDDNNEPAPEVRIEQTLNSIGGNWQYESITADTPEDYNGDENKSTDILSQYAENKKDDIIRFIPYDHHYEIWEKGVKDAKVIEKGTFTIDQDNKKIIMINSENDNRTTFTEAKVLQDNNGFGQYFLEYRDQENHLVVRKEVDIL